MTNKSLTPWVTAESTCWIDCCESDERISSKKFRLRKRPPLNITSGISIISSSTPASRTLSREDNNEVKINRLKSVKKQWKRTRIYCRQLNDRNVVPPPQTHSWRSDLFRDYNHWWNRRHSRVDWNGPSCRGRLQSATILCTWYVEFPRQQFAGSRKISHRRTSVDSMQPIRRQFGYARVRKVCARRSAWWFDLLERLQQRNTVLCQANRILFYLPTAATIDDRNRSTFALDRLGSFALRFAYASRHRKSSIHQWNVWLCSTENINKCQWIRRNFIQTYCIQITCLP